MKRGNNAPEQGAEKSKKPIYKKWWFWLIVVVVVIGVFAPKDKTEDPATPTPPVTSSTSSDASNPAASKSEAEKEPKVATEAEKEAAKAVDAEITAICASAEADYKKFLDIVSSESTSDLDAYNNAKTLKENLQYYNYTQLSDVKGDGIDDYKQAVSMYCFMMTEVAEKAMDYLDDPVTSKLSKFQEATEDVNTYVYGVATARLTFLSNAGFTSEEVTEITSTGAEE